LPTMALGRWISTTRKIYIKKSSNITIYHSESIVNHLSCNKYFNILHWVEAEQVLLAQTP
jgi:hypothetical protein